MAATTSHHVHWQAIVPDIWLSIFLYFLFLETGGLPDLVSYLGQRSLCVPHPGVRKNYDNIENEARSMKQVPYTVGSMVSQPEGNNEVLATHDRLPFMMELTRNVCYNKTDTTQTG